MLYNINVHIPLYINVSSCTSEYFLFGFFYQTVLSIAAQVFSRVIMILCSRVIGIMLRWRPSVETTGPWLPSFNFFNTQLGPATLTPNILYHKQTLDYEGQDKLLIVQPIKCLGSLVKTLLRITKKLKKFHWPIKFRWPKKSISIFVMVIGIFVYDNSEYIDFRFVTDDGSRTGEGHYSYMFRRYQSQYHW